MAGLLILTSSLYYYNGRSSLQNILEWAFSI